MVWDTAHQITFGRQSNNRLICSVIAVAVVVTLISSISWMITNLIGVGAGLVSTQQLVIIDTDPGVDDAVAILTTLGDKSIKVLAITCVRGNTDVPNVVVNALKILRIAENSEIPVYTGNNYGLTDTPATGSWYGSDGLEDLPFPNPPSASNAQKEHAASYLARIVKEYPGEITIFAIGPLTNIALALHLNPELLKLARRVVILGGTIRGQGNKAPGVEFNFYMDPDAANVVLDRALSSHTPVTLMPLETTMDNDLTQDWRWNTLAKINNTVVSFLNKLEKKELEMHSSPQYEPADIYAAAITLCPDFVTHSQELYGFVENRGERSRGALMIDYFNTTQNTANLEIITEVNTTVIKKKMFENLSNFK